MGVTVPDKAEILFIQKSGDKMRLEIKIMLEHLNRWLLPPLKKYQCAREP